MSFRDDPMRTVIRHWMCDVDGCDGEMLAHGYETLPLGEGMKNRHRCSKCGTEAFADLAYPATFLEPAS